MHTLNCLDRLLRRGLPRNYNFGHRRQPHFRVTSGPLVLLLLFPRHFDMSKTLPMTAEEHYDASDQREAKQHAERNARSADRLKLRRGWGRRGGIRRERV